MDIAAVVVWSRDVCHYGEKKKKKHESRTIFYWTTRFIENTVWNIVILIYIYSIYTCGRRMCATIYNIYIYIYVRYLYRYKWHISCPRAIFDRYCILLVLMLTWYFCMQPPPRSFSPPSKTIIYAHHIMLYVRPRLPPTFAHILLLLLLLYRRYAARVWSAGDGRHEPYVGGGGLRHHDSRTCDRTTIFVRNNSPEVLLRRLTIRYRIRNVYAQLRRVRTKSYTSYVYTVWRTSLVRVELYDDYSYIYTYRIKSSFWETSIPVKSFDQMLKNCSILDNRVLRTSGAPPMIYLNYYSTL